jgi:trans-aconitate methyltransferase
MSSGLWFAGSGEDREPPQFDTSVAHIARVYNYWLGGKDNFAADRAAGDQMLKAYPDTRSSVQANRAFLGRSVRFMVDQGIRQFLDIGTGLPVANNTHEVAQRIAPESKVVYVDSDPVVLAHARALLTSGPRGATGFLDADARDTGRIIAEADRLLDFSQPVGVMMVAVLHCIPDTDDPWSVVTRLMQAVAPGSYLVVSQPPSDMQQGAPGLKEGAAAVSALMAETITPRTNAEVSRFFDGLELLEPGVVPIQKWRPDSAEEANAKAGMWAGIGKKS